MPSSIGRPSYDSSVNLIVLKVADSFLISIVLVSISNFTCLTELSNVCSPSEVTCLK